MTWLRGLVVLLALPVFALPAPAQIFHRKARPIPAQRVPELILTLKTESDERKRASAAEELREYDPKTFSEIVPALVDVLHNDKKVNVRLEALNSLARLRPVSQPAGQALELAASADESLRVRLQAKSALLKYHLAGYSKTEPSVTQPVTQEPPLGDPSGSTTIQAAGTPAAKITPAVNGLPGSGLDLPRPLPAGVVLPPGAVATPPPTIRIETPSVPARPF